MSSACRPIVQRGVLLRAGEVVAGHVLAAERRGIEVRHRDLARGPARLATALGIELAENGADLLGGDFTVELPAAPAVASFSPRTGVSGAGGSEDFQWRYFAAGDPTVSPYRAAVVRRRTPR